MSPAVMTVHRIVIPGWHPARLNQWDGRHWSVRSRLKKADRELVGVYAKLARIPLAMGKRRVSLRITLGPRQRAGDPDAFWKSTLDALVHAGLLVDDNRQNVELGRVDFDRGPARATAIALEDIAGVIVQTPRRRSDDRRPDSSNGAAPDDSGFFIPLFPSFSLPTPGMT